MHPVVLVHPLEVVQNALGVLVQPRFSLWGAVSLVGAVWPNVIAVGGLVEVDEVVARKLHLNSGDE